MYTFFINGTQYAWRDVKIYTHEVIKRDNGDNIMKMLLPILVILSLLTALECETIPMSAAREVADHWYINRSGRSNTTISDSFARPDEQNPAVYVFNYSEGGFVMVSADDAAYPILGYSMNNHAPDVDNQPGAIWMQEAYVDQIEAIREANCDNAETREVWDSILADDFSGFDFTRDVEPMLTTTWNQNYPYNGDCPEDVNGPGGHALAGCGATAMGQVMRYWEHPEHGVGSNTYMDYDYGVMYADFENATYNWSEMPASITEYDPNIALALFHCGVAINTDYGAMGSSSQMSNIAIALAYMFDYRINTQYLEKYDFTVSIWNTLLINEVEMGRPVVYGGYGESGHAFVMDGHQGIAFFHFNFGWSGSYDGYYYLNDLSPGSYTFNYGQQAVVNIHPYDGPCGGQPPQNLTATVVNGVDVELNWLAPVGDSSEMRWDNGSNYTGIGTNSPLTFDVAIRFDTDDLGPFNGLTLTDVSFFPRYSDCEYSIRVWVGGSVYGNNGNAGMLIVDQDVDNFVVNHWNTVTLDEPIEIFSTEELWFGYHIVTNGGHPAGCDSGPAVTWKGDLVNMGNWASLSTTYPAFDFNWNIYGWADNGLRLAQEPARDEYVHLGYRIYRDGDLVQEFDTTDVFTWTDLGLDDDEYVYSMTAVYDSTDESIHSNIAIAFVEGNYPPPQNLSWTGNATSVMLEWEAPSDDTRLDDASEIDASDTFMSEGYPELAMETPLEKSDRDRPALILYNIYREYNVIDTRIPGQTTCTDVEPPNGFLTYYVTAVYEDGSESMPSNMLDITWTSAEEVSGITTNLMDNHPNPFNPVTQINFSIEKASEVTIEVYNLKGQLVRTLVDERRDSGNYSVQWTGEDNHGKSVGSGIYLYRMKAGEYVSTKKMILLK